MKNKKIAKLSTSEAARLQKIAELKFDIRCHQRSIKRLFEFASGIKQLKKPRLKHYQRTERDNKQLLETVACLQMQIEQCKQAIAILMG